MSDAFFHRLQRFANVHIRNRSEFPEFNKHMRRQTAAGGFYTGCKGDDPPGEGALNL